MKQEKVEKWCTDNGYILLTVEDYMTLLQNIDEMFAAIDDAETLEEIKLGAGIGRMLLRGMRDDTTNG